MRQVEWFFDEKSKREVIDREPTRSSYIVDGSGPGFGAKNARMLCWPSICLSGRRLAPAGFLLGGVELLLVPAAPAAFATGLFSSLTPGCRGGGGG